MSERRPSKPPYHFAHPLLRARDWQHRPELDALCDWWRDGGQGVCSLVGIGGAGKTASVERFLRLLPGVLPAEAGVAKDAGLAKPQRLFVFSFYDEANPDAFFAQLAAWLSDPMPREKERQPSYEQVLRLLERAGTCLLVLDGLEKVQDDGLRGGTFGELLDNRLRGLLLRIAEGRLPTVSVVITTRFVLEDLQERGSVNYRLVPIDRISEEAGVKLLRQRGVFGADAELRHIAEDCGCHALTVDLAGGYIALFGHGDPARAIDLALRENSAPVEADGQKALEVARQTARFERVALRYREALAHTDPAALALLERICLFRMGVDAEMLALIFTGEGKREIAGPHLAGLTLDEVRLRLDRLVNLRLLEATKVSPRSDRQRYEDVILRPSVFSRQRSTIYNIHPAVRDGFRSHLDPQTARLSHEAARSGLINSLGGLPGRDANPSDPQTLDLLEEIVYHALEAGQPATAWDIYTGVIGCYPNLGLRLGAYERGERLCRAFVAGRSPDSAPLPEQLREGTQAMFINAWALYLSDLGRLMPASRCYERNIALRLNQKSYKNASIGNQNLCDLLVLQGNLTRALHVSDEALEHADRAGFAYEHKDSFAYRGHVLGLLGETGEALRAFETALAHQRREEGIARSLYRMRGVMHAWLLVRLGRIDEAERITTTNRDIVQRLLGQQSHYLPRCDLLLSAIERGRVSFTAARELQERAHEWAVARDARELLCWSFWERASIELVEFSSRKDSEGLKQARESIEEGLWLARDCGFGLFHIDLLLLRARLALEEGDAGSAEQDARSALDEGHHPAAATGQPALPAITDPQCGYLWGAALARRLLGQSLLMKAEQTPGAKVELIEEGRLWLEASAATRRRLGSTVN